uniref:Uncharacterized protein n=1 Tax=Arundo donax TaxID=35708 RepID=A0A0A9BS45_ARUDO
MQLHYFNQSSIVFSDQSNNHNNNLNCLQKNMENVKNTSEQPKYQSSSNSQFLT